MVKVNGWQAQIFIIGNLHLTARMSQMKTLNMFYLVNLLNTKGTQWLPFLYVASYCYLSVTLRTISITVITLQDNRAVVRSFIALLSFSVDSPLYTPVKHCERTVSGSKNIIFFLLITLNPFILRHTHRLILLIMTVYLYLTHCISISHKLYIYISHTVSISHTLYIYITHIVYLYLTQCISISHTLYICISHAVYLYLTQCISISHTLYIYITHTVYLYLTHCISVSHTLYIYISHTSGDTCHKTINCLRTPRSVALLAVTHCITKVILILPLLW